MAEPRAAGKDLLPLWLLRALLAGLGLLRECLEEAMLEEEEEEEDGA